MSVSWPTAEISGIVEAAAARTTLGIGPTPSAIVECTFTAGSISSQSGYNATIATTGSAGIYLVTFGTAMSSANYAVTVSGTRSSGGGDIALCGYYSRTTTTVTIRVETNGGAGLAPSSLSVVVYGPSGLA